MYLMSLFLVQFMLSPSVSYMAFRIWKILSRLTLFILKCFIFYCQEIYLTLLTSIVLSKLYFKSIFKVICISTPVIFFKNPFFYLHFTASVSTLHEFKIRQILFYSPTSFLLLLHPYNWPHGYSYYILRIKGKKNKWYY